MMMSDTIHPAPPRGHDIAPRRRAAVALLACAALAGGTLACAKGKDASADSAALAAAPAVDSAAVAPATPAPSMAPADSTKPSESKRVDEATSAVARQDAKTRDTAHTGAVTPAPAVRKTATPAAAPKVAPKVAAKVAAKPAAPTPAAPAPAAPTPAPAAPAAVATRDTNPPAAAAAPAPAAQQAAAPQDDHLTASPAAYQGWKTFHVYCYRCHGTDAMGSDLAPNLRHSVGPEGSVTHEVFVTTVKEGRLPKGMPSWKALLSDEQIENVWAYLKARSSGQLAPGRPRQAKSD